MKVKRIAAMAAGIVLTGLVSAADPTAVWKDLKVSGTWTDPTCWTDKDGNALSVAPTNRDDVVFLQVRTNTATTITLTGDTQCRAVTVGAVSAPKPCLPQISVRTSGGFSTYPSCVFSLADPNGMRGFFSSFDSTGRAEYELRATTAYKPTLANVAAYGFDSVRVPTAGTTGRVERIYRNGTIAKVGAGDLEIGSGAGWDSRICCREGTVTLDGRAAADVEDRLPAGAWMHLDASRAASLETFVDEGGRTAVARWNDCDGGDVYAMTNAPASFSSYQIHSTHAPFISAERSPSGLPLVDFGQRWNSTGNLPSNCWLKVSRDCLTARTVLAVCRRRESYSSALLGWNVDSCYDFMDGGATGFFSGTYACAGVLNGDITVNGQPVPPYSMPYTTRTIPSMTGGANAQFHVLSVKMPTPGRFNALSTDRNYANYVGGYLIGEIAVYERELTTSEIKSAVAFLMAKWIGGEYRSDDVGEVVLSVKGAAVGVPEGQVARVKTLSAHSHGKIVKKGGGTLVVDGISPAGAALEIEGGSIRLATPAVSTLAPATNAFVWLDATKDDTLVATNWTGGVETRAYVTRWNDRRGADHPYAEVPVGGGTIWSTATYTDVAGHFPWRAEGDSPTGLRGINFGRENFSPAEASFMWLVPHDKAYAKCGFVAIRTLVEGKRAEYFGGTVDVLRNGNAYMLQQQWLSGLSAGISWSIDGQSVDVWQSDATLYANTNWHVVAFSGYQDLRAELLAKYTTNQNNNAGNVVIGEYLIYDRPLSADERRDTEAYLMNKWLGKPHPESAQGAAMFTNYTFAATTDAVIDNAADTTLTALRGGDGTLVKRGAGNLTVSDFAFATNVTAARVEAGALTLALRHRDDALYRFDASDAASFTETYTTDDGAGGAVTNIRAWADQITGRLAKSGVYNGISTTYASTSGSTCTNPTLVTARMPDGTYKSVVDFGDFLNVATLWNTKVNPKVIVPENMNSAAGLAIENVPETVREVFSICADRKATSRCGYLFTSMKTYNGLAVSVRGTDGLFFNAGANPPFIKEGRVWLDGTEVDPLKGAFTDCEFHLVNMQPTSAVQFNSIAFDRNCNAGDMRVGEYVAYDRVLEADERAYIQRRLMHKWLGTAAPDWPVAFSSLAAAAGTALTLNVEENFVLSVAALSGAGTITAAGGLKDVASFALEMPPAKLTVAGPLALAAAGTVTLNGDVAALAPGVYTLVAAEALTGFDPDRWILTNASRRPARLFQAEGELRLALAPLGSVIILR